MLRVLYLSAALMILLSGQAASVHARNLYVSTGHGIFKFSLTGADLGAFVSHNSGFTGIAFDDGGSLYAVRGGGDNLRPAIIKLAPDGTTVSTLYNFDLEAAISGALARDGDGNLYVSDDRGCRFCGDTRYVHKFSPAGADLGPFTPFLDSLLEVAFDSDGRLYVGQGFSQDGILRIFGPEGADLGTIDSKISSPSGIAFDSVGNLYVSGNGGIRKLSPTGTDLGMFVSGPSFRDLAFDDAGVLYAISVGEGTVRKFGPTGADLGTISLPVPERGNFLAFGPESDVAGGISIADAGPDDFAFLNGERSGNGGIPSPPQTLTYQALELLQGSSFTLDPHETLILTAGPLYIGPGAVFTGNGIIQGNVINAGLLRIPIVRVQTIAQVTGGHVQVELPESNQGIVVIDAHSGFGVGGGTLVSFEFNGHTPPAPIVIQGTPAPNEGTVRFDASLEITGSFEQRETGALRMFIGGNDMPGVNYSQLIVGEDVTLAGTIELVLQPELFGEFRYSPMLGDVFDLIVAPQGITIADTGLMLRSFSTQDGAALIQNVTFSAFNSGIAADPDRLFQIRESIFRLDLIENNTILRATLIEPIEYVPEPSTVALVFGMVLIHAWRRTRCRAR